MVTPLRVGIAGLCRGLALQGVFTALSDCRIVAVCDANGAAAREAAGILGSRP